MEIVINGSIEKFIKSLEKRTIAKILHTINLLEIFEYRLTEPHSKKVDDNIYELRIRGPQEVRMFYCYYKNRIFLLHGFVKKDQKIPKKEINLARSRFKQLTQYNL